MKRHRPTQGLTLVELLVAFSILGIVLIAVAPALLENAQLNRLSNTRTQAAIAVQQVLESYRVLDTNSSTTFPSTGSVTSAVTANGQTFQVTVTFCALASLCSGTAHQLTATAKLNGTSILSAETVFAAVNSDY